jgi:hypothetical protein
MTHNYDMRHDFSQDILIHQEIPPNDQQRNPDKPQTAGTPTSNEQQISTDDDFGFVHSVILTEV